jgi:hypothetical protein
MAIQVQKPYSLLTEQDVCPECLTKHGPEAPHDKDSLFYYCTFRAMHGRWPTWADAAAHCGQSLATHSQVSNLK